MTVNKCKDLGNVEEISTLDPRDRILFSSDGIDIEGNYIGEAKSIQAYDLLQALTNPELNKQKIKNAKKFKSIQKIINSKITDNDGEDVASPEFIEDLNTISVGSLNIMAVGSSSEETDQHFLTFSYEQMFLNIEKYIINQLADIQTEIQKIKEEQSKLIDDVDLLKISDTNLNNEINYIQSDLNNLTTQVGTLNTDLIELNEELGKIVIPTSYTDRIHPLSSLKTIDKQFLANPQKKHNIEPIKSRHNSLIKGK